MTDNEPRRVEYVRLDNITPAPRNAQLHDGPAIARSITHHGFVELPVVDGRTGRLVCGHGRHEQLVELRQSVPYPPDGIRTDSDGEWLMPVLAGWSSTNDLEAEAYLIASNRLPSLGGTDDRVLLDILTDLDSGDLLGLTGFDSDELAELRQTVEPQAPVSDPDSIPDPPGPITKTGDLWELGPHRLLCGDSTNPADVERLVDGANVVVVHADPPYGMGKESEGVANDNLYGDKLDRFQLSWWSAWLPHLAENASAYIWGRAPDLWRLWYQAGLSQSDDLHVRNELVWDKGSARGMGGASWHSYPTGTERCLFLMRGQQFLGNQNTDDYWEGYEPLRSWLVSERDKAGWSNQDVNLITGTYMAGHWFTRSQFQPITRNHYETLRGAAEGHAFTEGYDSLLDRFGTGSDYRADTRSTFDNTHDLMTDVWRFPSVEVSERYGHATPKPVAMVERAIKSSTAPGDVVAAPFSGTGPEIIASHRLGRVALAMELVPRFVDVACRRWQELTGEKPVRDGEPVDFTAT